MPKVEKILSIEINPEQFLRACSLNELLEIDLILTNEINRRKVTESYEQKSLLDINEEF